MPLSDSLGRAPHARDSLERAVVRRGLTLIEVVAGIALLATLLVSILVAHNRHAQQVRQAQGRLAAIEQLDRLLGEWAATGVWQPVGSEGELDGFMWRVVESGARVPDELGSEIVRVELLEKDRVLASVELLSAGGGVGGGL